VESRVPTILHPGLASHPQHDLAMKQMSACGSIFSIVLDGGRQQAHALLDALQLIDISNNIGDSRSLMCHPASTTHYSVAPEAREDMGVTEGMLRLNVGLEDPDDLIEDLDQAPAKLGSEGTGNTSPLHPFVDSRAKPRLVWSRTGSGTVDCWRKSIFPRSSSRRMTPLSASSSTARS
jgi:hypothetical protein